MAVLEESSFERYRFAGGLGFDEWRVRGEPRLDASELGFLHIGDVVLIVDRRDEWFSVIVEETGLQGWVLSKLQDKPCFVPAPAKHRNWAVLVCGGTRGSYYGTDKRPWRDLGGEIALLKTLGNVYAQMAAELGKEHVIVIAGLESTREWLRGMSKHGFSVPEDERHIARSKEFYGKTFNGDLESSKRQWKMRLDDLERSCEELIKNGGSDYDGSSVNPTTVLNVLRGKSSAEFAAGATDRVLPKQHVSSLFFWVTTHGSAHPISIDVRREAGNVVPVPIQEEALCEESCSLDANEWFWIMPHQATDIRSYEFVRLAGYTLDTRANPQEHCSHMPLYCVYWQQIFAALHRTMQQDPRRKIVAFYQFCLSGGHLSFLKRPAIRQHYGVDDWPILMVASSAANQNSLGGTFTELFLELLRNRLWSQSTLQQFFKELEDLYWQRHRRVVDMNQHLPKHMRLGEVEHYHTPNQQIETATLTSVFSNRSEPFSADARVDESFSPALVDQATSREREGADVQDDRSPTTQLVQTLVDMGFPVEAVETALQEADGRPDLAIDLLLR